MPLNSGTLKRGDGLDDNNNRDIILKFLLHERTKH